MPVYDYEHSDETGPDCKTQFELAHPMSQTVEDCPKCGHPVRKIVSRFSHHKNVLSTSNIKEKGFTRLRRKDKGVYEAD